MNTHLRIFEKEVEVVNIFQVLLSNLYGQKKARMTREVTTNFINS